MDTGPVTGFVCTHCQMGECVECIDILRVIISGVPLICKCQRPGHSGEPVEKQIHDPFSGSVFGPNIEVKADGTTRFIASITCPKCGMTSHNPNDIREQYCGNCNEYHSTMEL